jgi:DNA-binding MarR family transcriptional regulator
MELHLPFMGDKREFKLSADDVVMLTERGKQEAQDNAFSGARAQILMMLDNSGATSVKELSRDTRIPVDRVKGIVDDLMRRAWVRKVGYEG